MLTKIIVEGPNNVGKTSFINKLLETETFQDWRVEHLNGDCPNDYDFYDKILSDKVPTILDRCHLGELVYPKLYNRPGKLSDDECLQLSMKHADHCVYIFVDAEYAFICRSCKNKSEEFDLSFVMEERYQFDNIYCNMLKNRCKAYWLTNRVTNGYGSDVAKEKIIDYLEDLVN